MSETAKTSTKATQKAVASNDRALLTVADTPLVETDDPTTDATNAADKSTAENIKATVADAMPKNTDDIKSAVGGALPKTSTGRKKVLGVGVGVGLTALLLLLRHHSHKNSSPSLLKKVAAGAVTAKAVQALSHRTR